MADQTNKITEILKFEVDQGNALDEMSDLKRVMIGLKEEQAELNKAYKVGAISLEEYSKETVRVEQVTKKTGQQYQKLSHEVQGTKSWTDKLSASFKEQANQANIAGVNVGGLTQKVGGLLNPVTLAVGVVTALGAAYVKSAAGAKDFEFVSNQLSATTQILANKLGDLVGSQEDGEGPLTRLFNGLLGALGPAGIGLAAAGKAQAMLLENLEELARKDAKTRGEINDRLAENSELLAEIADAETTIEQKKLNISAILANLNKNESEQVGILQRELSILENQRAATKDIDALELKITEKTAEISRVNTQTQKKKDGILKLEDNIEAANANQLKAEADKLRTIQYQTSELERQARIASFERSRQGAKSGTEQIEDSLSKEVSATKSFTESIFEAKKSLADRVEKLDKKEADRREARLLSSEAEKDALRLFSTEAGRLFQSINEDQRAFAAAQLVLDAGLTLSGITKNAAALGPVAGPIYFAAAFISAGASLAKAAKLMGVSFGGLGSNGTGTFKANGQTYEVVNGVATAVEEPLTHGRVTIFDAVKSIFSEDVRDDSRRRFEENRNFRRLKRAVRRGYAEGGYTPPGDKYQPAGIVHAGEWVAPQHVVNNPYAASHLNALESMRLRGYYDGGIVKPPVVDQGSSRPIIAELVYSEFKRFVNSVEYIDQQSTR